MGWKFDHEKWATSLAPRQVGYVKVFKNFDSDGDGYLSMREFQRAFRALGLKKRTGEKMEVDQAMFDSFDTNGDGVVSLKDLRRTSTRRRARRSRRSSTAAGHSMRTRGLPVRRATQTTEKTKPTRTR